MGITTTAATMDRPLPKLNSNSAHKRVKSNPVIRSDRSSTDFDKNSLSKKIRRNKEDAADFSRRSHIESVPPKCIQKRGGHVNFDVAEASQSAAQVLGVLDGDIQQVKANLKAYLLNFQYADEGDPWFGCASDTQRELLEHVSVAQLNTFINSLEFYGGPNDPKSKSRAFCERYVYDVNGFCPGRDLNNEILGCSESYFRGDSGNDGNLKPERQLAWFMKTLVKRKGRSAVEANVLTVVAPALDNSRQPGYRQYVSKVGRLEKRSYRLAMETIANQVLDCSRHHDELSHVALAAVGMDAFLGSLGDGQKHEARKIGIEVYADLVLKLRKEGRTPVFQGNRDDPFWAKVNAKLEAGGHEGIEGLGLIPNCVSGNAARRTLWVNAGDASSLTGNRCNKDRSLDGYWGRSTLLHLQHMILAAVHNSGRKISDADSHSDRERMKPVKRRPMSWSHFLRR